MAASNAPKFLFINPPGDKSAASQRDQQLQATEARAHAARVSRRRLTAGIVKHGTSSRSATRLSTSFGIPNALALRPVLGNQSRRAQILDEVENDHNMSLDKRHLRSPSMSSLGQGHVDPFDSAPVQGLDNFIYSILDFAYDYAFPSFVPAAPVSALPTHRANRRRLGRQYGYLLEAQIAAAAKFQMTPMATLTEDDRQRIEIVNMVHERRAIDSLNEEVQRLETAPPDTLIYAAALLAYVSGPDYSSTPTRHPRSPLATAQNLHAMGHLEIVPERVQAVRSLVQLRGGIDELTMPFQRIVLTYLDTIVSTRLGVRPGWKWPAAIPESLQRTGEHILDQTAVDLMQTMGSGFSDVQHEGMHQALLLMCEATVAIDHCHRGGSTAPVIWDVARMRVAVQHRLCSFDPISLDHSELSDIQFELCRLSALIYSDLVLFPIPERTSVKPPLLDDLGRVLDKCDIEENAPAVQSGGETSKSHPSNVNRDFLAWSILLAAVAATSSTVFRPQYLRRLERIIHLDQRLRNWDFYRGLVRRYLWWDYLLDSLAWDAFNAAFCQENEGRVAGLLYPTDPEQSQGIKGSLPKEISMIPAILGNDLADVPQTLLEETATRNANEHTLTTDQSALSDTSPGRPDLAQSGEDARMTTFEDVGSKEAQGPHEPDGINSASDDVGSPDSFGSSDQWLREFQDSDLLQWVNIFFDRLYSTLPIVSRLTLYKDLMLGRHKTDPEFASLILALCALALVQPVFKAECGSMPLRTERAAKMLSVATRMRSFRFGENMTFEATVTSFLLFAALFGLGFQKASWLRLREAVECGRFIGLHQAETYHHLGIEEKGRRFRLFLLLSVTEREYALRWNHSIKFTGQNMEKMGEVYMQIEANSTTETSSILVYDERDLCAMRALLQLMKLFDSVDEDVIPCWNRTCCLPADTCFKLTIDRVRKVFDAITVALDAPLNEAMSLRPYTQRIQKSLLNELQWAYCFALQQWLLVRLWVSCLMHGLLDESSTFPFVRPSFSITIAEHVLEECHQLGQAVLEVHGVGMIERLHDIAMGVVMAAQFYVNVESGSSMERIHSILGRYFELLGRLRNGESRFISALRKAYESVQ